VEGECSGDLPGLEAHAAMSQRDLALATFLPLTREMRFTLFDNPEALPIDYRDIHVSDKVVRIIQSYTKIVNEMIWRK
jgi:hypothetical protein